MGHQSELVNGTVKIFYATGKWNIYHLTQMFNAN